MVVTPEIYAGPKGYISDGAEEAGATFRAAPNTGRLTSLAVEVESCTELGMVAILALGEGYPALSAEAVRRVGAVQEKLEAGDTAGALRLFIFRDCFANQIVAVSEGVSELPVTKRLTAATPVLLGPAGVAPEGQYAPEVAPVPVSHRRGLFGQWLASQHAARRLFHLAA